MTETPKPVETHHKLRLEIILESLALRQAEDILARAGATGWTVLPAVSGFGGNTRWSRGTDLSGSSDMVVIVSIGDASVIDAARDRLFELVERYVGILNVSPVTVLRPGLF